MGHRRWPLTLLLAVLCAASFAVPASAEQYCVGNTGTVCDGGPGPYPFTALGLGTAIAAAKATANADEVRIAAGDLTAVSAFTVDDPNGVTITGAGADATTLHVNAGAGAAITMTSGVANLRGVGITGAGNTGVKVSETGFLVPASQFDQLRIAGYARGFEITRTGLPGPTIEDTLIDLGSAVLGRGILAMPAVTPGATLFSAHRLTIVGRGTSQVGIDAEAPSSNQTASGAVTDTLIYLPGGGGATVSLKCVDGAGTANIDVQRSSFYPNAQFTTGDSGCSNGAAPTSIVSALDAEFVNSSAGDYHLLSFSAAIDQGTTTAPTETLDAGRGARFVDGDGDGTAAVDLGAYEYQHRPPAAPVIAVPETTVAPGAALKFTAAATDPDPGDYLQYSWDFGDGTPSSNSSAPTHAFASLGTFTTTVTATDPTGLKTSSSVVITVENPPGPPNVTPAPTPGPGGIGQIDLTTLHVRVLVAPSRSIKRSTSGFATVASGLATTAKLEVGGAATLRVSLARLVPGRLAKGKCKASGKTGKRCTAKVAVSAIGQIPVTNGLVNLKFGGTLGGKRLAAGTYEATIVPVAVNKKRGAPATYRFKLR